ncbi:hypothetical protein PIB30_000500 [Stylosanthes scabra]|uniref:Uncharacterized protein n=1 Tax=Stylosanthes scabra TaxID=79078 RepID=A0ABU6W154_9FABA|nr:hypothetical protein [Stylosanthes scabra]
MASRKALIMLLFCLVATATNLVTLTSARKLPNEKKGENGSGVDDENNEVVNPNNNNNKNTKAPKMMGFGDEKQIGFPPIFPIPSFPFPTFPFPFPQIPFGGIPGFSFPPLPIPATPFPGFPPLDIPGIVPAPPST